MLPSLADPNYRLVYAAIYAIAELCEHLKVPDYLKTRDHTLILFAYLFPVGDNSTIVRPTNSRGLSGHPCQHYYRTRSAYSIYLRSNRKLYGRFAGTSGQFTPALYGILPGAA